jgi:hypothetical protein
MPLQQAEDKYVAYWGNVGYDIEENYAWFELWNVYPCLTADMRLTIVNDGTIPAGLKDFGLVYLDPACCYDYEIFDTADGYHVIVYDYACTDFDPPIVAEVWVSLSASTCVDWPTNSWYQVDPGCEAYADIRVHFDECLPQNTIFRFGFMLEYWNWNEVEVPPPA